MTQPTEPDRAPRADWGRAFRDAVASGRAFACLLLLVSFPFVAYFDGLAQGFAVVVGLFSLVAVFPKSPLVPAVVQWLPTLPTKGGSD